MTIIGFTVNKKEREELTAIAYEMSSITLRHPVTGQAIQFLPPGSGTGNLVKVSVSEYIRYFNALKNGQISAQQQHQHQQAPKDTVAAVAQQAVQRSMATPEEQRVAGARQVRPINNTPTGQFREIGVPESEIPLDDTTEEVRLYQ